MRNFVVPFLTLFLLVSSTTYAQDTLPEASVMNEKGESIKLHEYVKNGGPKVINLWATWCGPCRMKFNDLSKVSQKWKREYNVEIVAISVDIPQMVGRARKLFETSGWDYTFFHDSKEEIMTKLGIQNIPYSMLIDKNGKIVSVHNRYSPNYTSLLEKEILALHKL